MKHMRAGIIGCGGIANSKHMPAIKKLGLTDLVAFCDLIEEKAVAAKESFGTEDALNAGKNVLCEKNGELAPGAGGDD